MGKGVVITRPRAQADALVARLAEFGVESYRFPLLEIRPIADSTALRTTLARLSDYAMVAFVSPNAIDAAFEHIQRWPSEVVAAVVGEGSRQALARHGLTESNTHIASPVDPHRTDSETLLDVLDMNALIGRRVLIVRAETGRELLADRLRSSGVLVEQIAAYQRALPMLDAERRAQLIDLLAQQLAWVITSSEALRHLLEMVRQLAQDWALPRLLDSQLIVPHPRIAETAHALGFTRVTQTASGDEALLAAIQSAA